MIYLAALEVNAQALVSDPSVGNPNYELEKQQKAGQRNSVVERSRENAISTMRLFNSSAELTALFSNSDCFVPLDDSYTAVPVNDDGSYGPISLPFTYDLYGAEYNQVWINTNGNLTFTGPVAQYSSTGFPFETPMVAAFWGDVDTREGGQIYFKLTDHSLIVTYDNVGYYGAGDDTKANTFQLIITDGTDPLIGVGQNTAFYYKDMQWTTGTASSGAGGFGGTPATIGINKGNNSQYIQVGRFDANTVAYDGPGGSYDGVNYLDNKCFDFSVGDADNIPPSVSNLPSNNRISLLVGESISIAPEFIGPEVDQEVVTTVSTSMCDVTHSVINGAVSTASITIVGSVCNVGTNTITIEATDNGVPVRSIRETITVEVVNPCSVTVDTKNILVQLDENGEAIITADDINNNSSASCGIASMNVAPNVFNCSMRGENTVTLTVTDSTGTEGTATATVTVEDRINPTIVAPAAITILNDAGQCGASSVALGNAIVADNCAIASAGNDAPAVFPIGPTTVTWTVTDESGNSASATQMVTVTNELPVISEMNVPEPPQQVNTVVNVSASFVDNNLSAAQWNWGDGSTSEGSLEALQVSGRHSYTSPGNYTISLTVTDACGATATMQYENFAVEDSGNGTAPVARAGENQEIQDADGNGEESVMLDGSGSTDDDGSIVAYSWSVGGTEIATGVNPAVILPLGITNVMLTVTDNDGLVGTDEVMIQINALENIVPIADAGDDQELTDTDNDGEVVVRLDGAGSSDPDGTISTYSWSMAGTEIASGVNPEVMLPVGSTSIILTVTDNLGATDTDEVMIQVNAGQEGNIPPVVSAGQDRTVRLPQESLQLSGTGHDPDGRFRSFRWEKISGPELSMSNARTANAKLSDLEEGVYEFRFSATDNDGATSSDDMTLTVEPEDMVVNLPPRIFSAADRIIVLPANSAFFFVFANDPDGTISTYSWQKLEGPEVSMEGADSPTLSLSGLEEGNYLFEVTVTDNLGAEATEQVSLSVVGDLVTKQAPVVSAGQDKIIRLPQTSLQLSGTGRDPDGRFTAFFWEKVSGPDVAMSGARTANTRLSDLEEGVYVFRFSATDNDGITSSDEMILTVEGQENAITISAAPNTFDNYIDLKVEAAESGEYMVKVWNLSGQLVHSLNYKAGGPISDPYRIDFSGSNLKGGLYLLQVAGKDNNFRKVLRIVKK